MKIRIDFVTNSSSSSFILARKPKWSEKQKEAIIRYVESNLLGEKLLGPESSEEEIQNVIEEQWSYDDEIKQKVRNALKEGKSVYGDTIDFEICDYDYAGLLENLWKVLEENDDGSFDIIDGDLSY